MVRLVGVDLPRNKKIAYALTYIHGVGLTSAKKLVELANISLETRTSDLTTEEVVTLRQTLEDSDLKLEGDLRRFHGLNIKRLNEINCHRGKRHRNSLPVRGQRTRTNARSRRGSKKTVTGKKKKVLITILNLFEDSKITFIKFQETDLTQIGLNFLNKVYMSSFRGLRPDATGLIRLLKLYKKFPNAIIFDKERFLNISHTELDALLQQIISTFWCIPAVADRKSVV